MDSPILKNTIVFIICILVLSYFGYTIFVQEPVSTDFSQTAEDGSQISGQEILILTNKLKNTSIDQSFFSSVVFLSLHDFQPPLTPETQGRANPFSEIGVDGSFPTTVTQASVKLSSVQNQSKVGTTTPVQVSTTTPKTFKGSEI